MEMQTLTLAARVADSISGHPVSTGVLGPARGGRQDDEQSENT